MDDRYRIKEIDHSIRVLDQGMFYGVGAEDDAFPSVPLVAGFVTAEEHHLIAYWLPWHPQEYTPGPATIDLELKDCEFEKPVRIDLLTGKVFQIETFENSNGNIVFRHIPLSDYPFLIAELEEIDMR